jgi:hypothetical protein
MAGSPETCLVILRGNSASGRSADESEEQIVARLLREVDFGEPPVRARFEPAVHLD